MQSPEIWANQKKASELGSQIRDIKDNLEFLGKWESVISDAEVALEIEDEDLISEINDKCRCRRHRCSRLGKFVIKNVFTLGRK